MPIHQILIEKGLLQIDRSRQGRLFKDATQNMTTHSQRFKEILVSLNLWEKKKTVLHSFRNSAKDMWRERGIPLDVRNAFTGHASVGAGERSYGVGLSQMPDKLNEYLQQVDVSWLP